MPRQGKFIDNSEGAYEQLKVITDAAQAGLLKPWGVKVIELLNGYGVTVDRRIGVKAEVTLSFPTTPANKSMGIGVRHMKPSGDMAEDFFLFEESVGLTTYYRGSQEDALPEYKGTHHAGPSVALQESLPGIQDDINKLKEQLKTKGLFDSIDMSLVVTDDEHLKILKNIADEYRQTTLAISSSKGAPVEYVSMKIKPEFDKKRMAQMHRMRTSQAIYNDKLAEIESRYEKDSDDYRAAAQRLNRLFGKTS